MLKIFKKTAAICAFSLASFATIAADFPNKPINIVVPFGAGSATDILARGVAKGLSERIGQPVTIENKAGAGGNVGASSVARSQPDGYTLLMGTNGPMAANASLFNNLPFHPVDDFEQVALMGRLPMVLIANADVKSRNLTELIKEAKQHPGTINFGASNTTGRVWIELLKREAGIDVATILYSNVGGMMTDLISGRVSYAFENVGPSMPQISAGKIRALAVTSKERAAILPAIPTMAEGNIDKHDLIVWFALFAPKGTPEKIVTLLNKEVNAVLMSEEVQRLASQIGMTVAPGTPAELKAYQQSEVNNWKQLIDLTGVTIQ